MPKTLMQAAARSMPLAFLDRVAIYCLVFLGGWVGAYNHYHVPSAEARIERLTHREELMYQSLLNMSEAYDDLAKRYSKDRYDSR